MSVYKSLNSQDIIVSPFEVNKSFTFTGGDTLLSASIERHVCSSNISSSLYNSIKQLYYSNYISGSNGEVSNANTASIGSDGLLSGPTYNTLYDNYLSTDLNPQRCFPGNNIGVMSIPKNLYGDYIQPNSFDLICSGSRYIDNGEGIIQKYQEPYFTFCAPEDFDPASQPVNIIDIFNKYSKLDKKYIFTLRDTLDKFSLTQGTTARHGYEIAGVKYVDDYNVVGTTIVGTLSAGNYTEIPVVSTAGFKDSGIIRVFNQAGWAAGIESYYEFVYVSKTSTSFIGDSQNIPINFGSDTPNDWFKNSNVVQVIPIIGVNNWILISGILHGYNDSHTQASIVDVFGNSGGNSISAGQCYEWLYCGRTIDYLDFGGPGLGYGSVKYIQFESDTQLKEYGYANNYGVPLTGALNIPKSLTRVGGIGIDINNGGAGWVGLDSAYLTRVIISENITLINSGFNYHNTVTRFDCYPLTAPVTYHLTMRGHPVPLHIKPNATGYDVAPWNDPAIFSEIIQDLVEDPNYVGNIIYEHGIISITNESNTIINTFVSSSNITASFSSSYQLYETQYKCTITENEYNYTNNPSLTSGSDGKLYDHFTGSYFAPYITTVGLYNDNEELLAVGKLSQPLPTSRTTDTNIIISLDRL